MRISTFYDERTDDVKVGRIIAVIVLLVVVLGIVLGVLRFVGGWGKTASDVVSGPNVKAQHTAVIQEWESLKAAANNACTAQGATAGTGSPTMVEDPAFAYAATYRTIAADYNRRQANLFEASLVGPPGYPDTVPALDVGPDTDWCAAATTLATIN